MPSNMHLVFGGRVKDPRRREFVDLPSVDIVGIFSDYDSALDAWRSSAQRTVDDAEMKYVIVPLHKLLEPELDNPTPVETRARLSLRYD